MAKQAGKGIPLPEKLTFESINGQDFMKVKSAAKLAGIHPDVLTVGKRLLSSSAGEAFVFKLGTPDMVAKADAIEAFFVKGLRKVAKAFGGGKPKSYLDRDQKRLVFWIDK